MVQMSLMKARLMETLIVLSCMTFDPVKMCWSHETGKLLNDPAPVHACSHDFVGLHGETVMNKHFQVICSLLAMGADKEIVVLLSLVTFFGQDGEHDDDAPSGSSSHDAEAHQEHFIHLLKMYIRFKFGPKECAKMFDCFMYQLSDVRQAHQLHRQAQLRLSRDQLVEVEQKMGGLKILETAGVHHRSEVDYYHEDEADMPLDLTVKKASRRI